MSFKNMLNLQPMFFRRLQVNIYVSLGIDHDSFVL
jgi:hypothetical protein